MSLGGVFDGGEEEQSENESSDEENTGNKALIKNLIFLQIHSIRQCVYIDAFEF